MYIKQRKVCTGVINIDVDRKEPEIRIDVKIKDEVERICVKKEVREAARKICQVTDKRVAYSVQTF